MNKSTNSGMIINVDIQNIVISVFFFMLSAFMKRFFKSYVYCKYIFFGDINQYFGKKNTEVMIDVRSMISDLKVDTNSHSVLCLLHTMG